ncbi:hypothetical protein G3T14_18400 [Methylobacterium sp. BTF04]|uniref:hypothetical protein n=1 Tax=Methylobacterium sp. BTF04 TaxID=2708300 RepID=UPI0013D2A1E3|nr:hypothetical protein [Methylobacterium sp. BTF04]NEU14084.1 hypothetical protein [Methylobacterium sp. BTF04]
MSRGKWVTLKLHQLRLDQENYRLGPQATQRDAIRAMIDEQGSKLVRIAKDIMQMGGISPGEPIWVIPAGTRGQYIVEEGNRRITVLKLLETPALADGTPLSKQFRKLSKIFAESPIREVDGRLFDSREDVTPWKRRRHMTAGSGVGLASWKPLAKGRANRDIGLDAPRSLAVVEFFGDDRSDQWAEILEALDGRWTTVDRVLNAGPFKETLGVDINPKTSVVSFENGDETAGKALLQRILSAMADPEFEFIQVEDKDDRKDFIDKFSEFNVKAAPGAPKWGYSSAPTSRTAEPQNSPSVDEQTDAQIEASSDESLRPVQRSNPSPTRRQATDASRKTLAPQGGPRLLPVRGIRLGPLYNECRKIIVKNNENAAAFLVRVFIELSSEVYLEVKKVPIPPNLKNKSVTEWSDYKVKLSEKISAVIHSIDPSGKSPIFVQAKSAIKPDYIGHFSIKTLHSYFHNHHVLPEETTVKASWDGWEAYLRALHTALNEPD